MVLVKPQVTLIVKNGLLDPRTLASGGLVTATENNLADWLVRCSVTNTGYSKTNNGTLTLRIDQAGTFIRASPILVDQNTKNNYLIEIKFQQDLNGDDDVTDTNEQGKTLRAIIGQPQISIDQSFGEILTINLVGIEYRLKEIPTSTAHIFRDPNDSFGDRLAEINYETNGIFINSGVNALPQSPKLSWIPQSPTTVHDTLADIIDTLALPQTLGGTFQDYYFDFSPDPSFTNYIDYKADGFGDESSGVTIDPLSIEAIDSDQEQTIVTDNMEYKNHVILVGSSTGGSLPRQRSEFASEFLHAELRSDWSSASVSYVVGDLVKFEKTTTTYVGSPSFITYHVCLMDHTSTATTPFGGAGLLWEQDFTTIPVFKANAYYKQGEVITSTVSTNVKFYQAINSGTFATTPSADPTNWSEQASVPSSSYTGFFSYTPWTNDEKIWKETLAGYGFTSGAGYAGHAFDWNVTRSNYKRKKITNNFEPVSVKWVTSMGLATPPSNPYTYDGNRYIVGVGATGAWSGMTNRIAEWDSHKTPTAGWQFSEAPVENDTINDLYTSSIYTFTSGAWVPTWEWDNSATTDRPSPFHACKTVGLVASATNIPWQAVEFYYDWGVNSLDIPNTHYNRTSRGAWICMSFPFPRLNTTLEGTGGNYGGEGDGVITPDTGTFNTDNMDMTSNGYIGWNQGVYSEDMGKVTALQFKMRCSIYKDANNLSDGVPNIPMTFWCTDKFDRVWFSKFKLRRNGQWDNITIPIGSLAPQQLYHSRWDELALLNDVVLTQFDFQLKEREFTGVAFDWRYVKHMGWFMDESYVDTGLYKNGLERALQYGENVSGQLASNPYWLFGPIIQGLVNYYDPPVKADVLKSFVKIALDDLHFVKELIVNSSETTLTDPRTSIEHMSNESDYKNLKQRSIGMASRKSFFPQMWHIRAVGDVRLQYGKTFTVTGSRVPSGTQTMVASEVKHIFDHDGYHVELLGVRKFSTSG